MAEAIFIASGAAFWAALSEEFGTFYKAVKDGVSNLVWCKEYCQELQQDLDELQPILDQIWLPADLLEEEKRSLERLKETLAEGRSLVAACLQRGGWMHPFERYRCSNQLLKLRQKIWQHTKNLPLLSRLQLQQVNAALQDVNKRLDKMQKDMIDALNSKTPLRDWLRQGASSDRSTGNQMLGKYSRLDEPIQEDQFLVGLENQVQRVKSLLLHGKEEDMVMIVGGMGGIGKTTLAIAVCNDPEVKSFFENRIHFFTVSQSPDMKALLCSIWEKVVGGGVPVPHFQNEEDAYRQVRSKLLSMSSNGLLLVLDDVWSKADLEKLSFEGQGLKTMITTRQAPTLETRQGVTYNLGLLPKENAQCLFCYWAFGEDSIPSWVADPLVVEEVISECKCLPLALKVIGASLSRVAGIPAAWRNARDKLREAMPLDDHHENALQRRLQTSIDALDPKLRQCFLDLGAHPEDCRCSLEFLLDVWVYVRGMTWDEAVLALVELGSRCLLDFHPTVKMADVGDALEYGYAGNIKFTQHDVMRDLALHLGRRDCPPSRLTRLFMPQRGENVPADWQSDGAVPFAAQLISIRTGRMVEKDWSDALAFPNAEALLLDISHCPYVKLPPFIQSMRNLKVLCIEGPSSIDASFEGLGQLQSICMRGELHKDSLSSLGDMHKLEKLCFFPSSDDEVDFVFLALGSLRHLTLGKPKQVPSSSVHKMLILQSRFNFVPHDLKKLPDTLGQLSALQELCLRNCVNLRYLPETLGQLLKLKKLEVSWCTSLKFLPDSVGGLSCLESLILDCCVSLKHLPENFGGLSCLGTLSLIDCGSLRHLPESFGNLSRLRTLELRGVGLRSLPETFGQLVKLKKLGVSRCTSLGFLPDSFGGLSCLESLTLDHCVSLKHLPESFGGLSCLGTLSLNDCGSLRHLPESFGNLSRLRTLEMMGVGLTSLPETFGQLVKLKKLGVSRCTFLRFLPDSFGGLSCLESLTLDRCVSLKHLPESFGNLSRLRTLEMRRVRFDSLPASVCEGRGGLPASVRDEMLGKV